MGGEWGHRLLFSLLQRYVKEAQDQQKLVSQNMQIDHFACEVFGQKYSSPEKLSKAPLFCIRIAKRFWADEGGETKGRDSMAQAASEQGWGITEGWSCCRVVWLDAQPERLWQIDMTQEHFGSGSLWHVKCSPSPLTFLQNSLHCSPLIFAARTQFEGTKRDAIFFLKVSLR